MFHMIRVCETLSSAYYSVEMCVLCVLYMSQLDTQE